MKNIFFIAIFLAVFTPLALAQQNPQTISLKDGTSIKGQLIDISNGQYTVNTSTMGQIKVPASQILSIHADGVNPGSSSVNSGGKFSADTVNSMKNNMMQDPEIMSLMQDLVKDPEIAAIMQNPSLMQDALSMDPERIKNNPAVQKLMQNPKMLKILEITAQKMQPSGH